MKALILILIWSVSVFAIDFETVKSEYKSLLDKPYILLPHEDVYFLPVVYNASPNNKPFVDYNENPEFSDRGDFNDNLESEFQISFLLLTNKNIWGTGFNTFIGYTHRAFWQIYNEDWSRPFRETNYKPEIFARYLFEKPSTFFGLNIIAYDFGLIHESNGQIQELSRSWNRAFLRLSAYSGDFLINISVWHRFEENKKEDENPNIYRYKGYGDIEFLYQYGKLDTSLKIIPGTKKQGYELGLSYPWKEGLKFYTKASYGYGLSLLDYDHDNKRIGVGIVLSNILDRDH
jgi:phospholipase A1